VSEANEAGATPPVDHPDLDRPRPLREVEGRSVAEEFLDDLMPPEIDWRRLVRRHPIPSLVVAAAAGYWLGRSRKGRFVADALAGWVASGFVSRFADLASLDGELDDHAEGFI
jgi:hypothetical protein